MLRTRPLLISGSPTFNGDTVTVHASADRIQAPSGVLDSTQGWFVMRLKTNGWDNATATASGNYFFEWGPTVNDRISFYFGSSAQSGGLRLNRTSGGSGTELQNFIAFTAGTDITMAAKWSSALLGSSLNGAPFSTLANANIPTLAHNYFDIGRVSDRAAAGWLDGTIYWCAAGIGTLSDADVAYLDSFGNTNPDFADLSDASRPTFLWTAVDPNVLAIATRTIVVDEPLAGSFGALVPTGPPVFDTAVAYSGPASMRANGTAVQRYATYTYSGAPTGVIGRFLWYPDSTPSVRTCIMRSGVASGRNIYLYLRADGRLELEVSTSAGATPNGVTDSAATPSQGSWHLVEYYWDVSTNPWTLRWSLNNIAQTTSTPVETASTISNDTLGNIDFSDTLDFHYQEFATSITPADYPLELPLPIEQSPVIYPASRFGPF